MTDPAPPPPPNQARHMQAALDRWLASRPEAARAFAKRIDGRIDRALLRRDWDRSLAFLSRRYSGLLILLALAISAGVLAIGLWRVPFLVNDLLTELMTTAKSGEAENTRSVIFALAAVLATITIIGTLITQSIRVWTSERQTRTTEQGHVTDRLTKAIEQLGAEKTVKRILKDADGNDVLKDNVPVVVETTVPNLEVRLGAIYALERIAQDSERDHQTIMEILCAYIRENTKAAEAPPNPLGDWPEQDVTGRQGMIERRGFDLRQWLDGLPAPRVDLQAAATVIGRRQETRRQAERRGPDLRRAHLRCADLSEAHLENADLRGIHLEGASLFRAHLEGAFLREAHLVGASLREAHLEGADLFGAHLEGADLRRAHIEGADLFEAHLERANLFGVHLKGVDLRQANLERAYLGNARLEAANLIGAHLVGAELDGAQLAGADLTRANLTFANLQGAHLERANLRDARLDRADLRSARLEGAVLFGAHLVEASLSDAHLEGVDLYRAQLERANLREAHLYGVDLREANFRDANWSGASNRASLAQFADFRTSQDLSQSQLEYFIGNDLTLLPDRPNENGEPYYVWSCWETPPENFNDILAIAAGQNASDDVVSRLRHQFLASPDNPRRKTGTPLALDAPYQEGHPLAKRD